MTRQYKINRKTLTGLGKTTKCTADSHQLLLRSRRCSVLQLLQVACSQLHMPADYTTLLVNGTPLVSTTHYPLSTVLTLYSTDIDDKAVLTVVAKQPVSLKCHHVTGYLGEYNGQHKTKVVQFEPGKPLGEPWWALHGTLVSCFLIPHCTMTPSHCGGTVRSRSWFSMRVLHPHPQPY